MSIHANSLSSAGYAVGSYTTADPLNDGLSSLYEDSLYMVNTYTEGYWTLSENGMNSANYDVDVEATGYNSVDAIGQGTRLLTRPEGNTNWTLDGNHVDATGSTIQRDNISTLSAEFAVADTMSCMPNTSDISGADTVCANATGVPYTVMEHSGSVYRWFITGGTQASGSNTDSITVDWGSASPGRVSVVEDNGCAIGDTVRMDVTINPYPDDPGVISPTIPTVDTIVEGNSKIYSISDVAEADYYSWSVPGDLSGSSDSTEITITASPGSAGNTYTIEVVGVNSCGTSSTPSSKDIYIEEGLPGKPTTPIGPLELCQDAPGTDYTTNQLPLATSYVWDVLNGGTSGITGTDTTGTLNLASDFNGTLGIRVRGTNANGDGPWSDTTNVTIHPQPDACR